MNLETFIDQVKDLSKKSITLLEKEKNKRKKADFYFKDLGFHQQKESYAQLICRVDGQTKYLLTALLAPRKRKNILISVLNTQTGKLSIKNYNGLKTKNMSK